MSGTLVVFVLFGVLVVVLLWWVIASALKDHRKAKAAQQAADRFGPHSGGGGRSIP